MPISTSASMALDAVGKLMPALAPKLAQAAQRPLAQGVEHAQHVGTAAVRALHALGVLLKQVHQPPRGLHRALRGLLHAFQEEIEPGLPVAVGADRSQQLGSTRAGAA